MNCDLTFFTHFFHRRKNRSMPPTPPSKDSELITTPPTPPRPLSGNMKPLPATPDYVRYTSPPPVFTPKQHLSHNYRYLTPEERNRRRQSAQRRHQLEEQESLREEQARITRRIQEKEEQTRREAEEEARRVALLKQHLQLAATRRQREEQDAKDAENRRLREISERKESEQQRRLQYTRELEKWRSDHIARVASQSSEKEEERRQDAEERRGRVAQLSERVLQAGASAGDALCGWLTIQPDDAIDWKRRYFMFDLEHGHLTLCRDQRDSTRTIDLVNLDGCISSFHEWYEGFEELEAIPHSFAVTFVDGRTWRIYADTEDDKDRLLVLLSEAAGVIV